MKSDPRFSIAIITHVLQRLYINNRIPSDVIKYIYKIVWRNTDHFMIYRKGYRNPKKITPFRLEYIVSKFSTSIIFFRECVARHIDGIPLDRTTILVDDDNL